MFFSPPEHFPEARCADAPRVGAPGDVGSYLTDGHNLYRVVASLGSGELHEFALLEDCATLDVFVHRRAALHRGALTLLPRTDETPMASPVTRV